MMPNDSERHQWKSNNGLTGENSLFEDDDLPRDRNLFGGKWTLTKLEALGKYLPAFTTALSKQNFNLLYIDAFAGTGRCDITLHGRKTSIPGSARRALGTNPPFHTFRFIEIKTRKLAALEALRQEYPDKDIEIIQEDANSALRFLCGRHDWRNSRAVLLLDPFGLHVEWATLEAIAKTGAIDVWYLFPYSGLYRQAAKDASALDSSKEESITRILGTDAWREAFYAPRRQSDIFDTETSDERAANHGQMLEYVSERLRSIFSAVTQPKILYQAGTSKSPSGAPLFALYFAASNPDPRAHGLAIKIAQDVLKSL